MACTIHVRVHVYMVAGVLVNVSKTMLNGVTSVSYITSSVMYMLSCSVMGNWVCVNIYMY